MDPDAKNTDTTAYGPVAQWLKQGTHKGMFKRAENGVCSSETRFSAIASRAHKSSEKPTNRWLS